MAWYTLILNLRVIIPLGLFFILLNNDLSTANQNITTLNTNYVKMSISSYSTSTEVKALTTTTDGTYSAEYTVSSDGLYSWYLVYTGSDTQCLISVKKGSNKIQLLASRQHDNTMYYQSEPIFLLNNTIIELKIVANGTWNSSIRMYKYS